MGCKTLGDGMVTVNLHDQYKVSLTQHTHCAFMNKINVLSVQHLLSQATQTLSVSFLQNAKQSGQIGPNIQFACCTDMKQTRNKLMKKGKATCTQSTRRLVLFNYLFWRRSCQSEDHAVFCGWWWSQCHSTQKDLEQLWLPQDRSREPCPPAGRHPHHQLSHGNACSPGYENNSSHLHITSIMVLWHVNIMSAHSNYWCISINDKLHVTCLQSWLDNE